MRVKNRLYLIVLILYISFSLRAQTLDDFMSEMLLKNSDYQEAVYRLHQEKASHDIDSSSEFGELSLSYSKNDNEIERSITKSSVEDTEINEEDERWKVEYTKQFFPKDFDATEDAISYKINKFRYQQSLLNVRLKSMNDILEDMIEWYEISEKLTLYKEELGMLHAENVILDEYEKQNIVSPNKLLKNLKAIDKLEDRVYYSQSEIKKYEANYGERLEEFRQVFNQYMLTQPQADTLSFTSYSIDLLNSVERKMERISNSIKLHTLFAFLPEVNLSVSYNQRDIDQDWVTTEDGDVDELTRVQSEVYPEAELELSIPLNLFSNIRGKNRMLKSFKQELRYRKNELQLDLNEFVIELKTALLSNSTSVTRKERIHELSQEQLNGVRAMFNENPELLGAAPEDRLQEEIISASKAEINYNVSRMNLFKTIYIMNRFDEGRE